VKEVHAGFGEKKEKPDKNGPLGRLSRRWEVRFKMDPRGIRFEHVAWTDSE
jgi:hypothetical protein